MAETLGFNPEPGAYKFEPLRQSRWELSLGDSSDSFNRLKLILLSCDRPQVSTTPVEVHHFNDRFYLAGKPEFQSINFVMYDALLDGEYASQHIEKWHNEVYNPQTNVMNPAEGEGGYKREATLTMMSGAGENLLSWKLLGCFPATVNYNNTSLDYSSSDPLTIGVELRIDKAYIDQKA